MSCDPQSGDSGGDYSAVSFGDAMSAALLAFMLITLLYMVMLRIQREEARRAEERAVDATETARIAEELAVDATETARLAEERVRDLERQIDERLNLQRVIIGALRDQLMAQAIEVYPDPTTGDLSIRESLLFAQGEAALTPEGQEFIRRLIATYVDVIYAEDARPEFRETVVRIVVEGYTSDEGDALLNMRLGAARATAVYQFAIGDPSLSDVRSSSGWSDFESALLVSSRGEIGASHGSLASDRRVVFRFQFRTVDSVIELLNAAGYGAANGGSGEAPSP